jgi:hypothetical protein
MPLPYHESRPIEHLPVDFHLRIEPAETVPIRLNFVPMKEAIHNSHVDSHLAPAETEFINDNRRIRIIGVFDEKPRSEGCPNCGVAKD